MPQKRMQINRRRGLAQVTARSWLAAGIYTYEHYNSQAQMIVFSLRA